MKIRTQLKAGGINSTNHNEALQVRTALKAGKIAMNHNEALQVRTSLKAGGWGTNHNETLQVRSALKAGGVSLNHNESLRVRSTLKAGGGQVQHNESLLRATDRPAVSMRRELLTTSRKEDRLELLVVRAGLRAGRRSARGRSRR
jgi:hypothetical protein